ncbi:MAG: M1 family metallopeptidase, partial [Patescibacteria group bacterium]
MKMTETSKSIRLADRGWPYRYRLIVRPNLADFTFITDEIAFFDLKESTTEITLHADELEVDRASYIQNGEEINSQGIAYDDKAQTVTFSFVRELPSGRGELRLKFKGVLNDKMRGFYRSTYKQAGKTCYLATTQFEATDARRAFLCIDEPAAKAIFDITIIVPEGCTAISNTIPEVVKEHEPGFKIIKFAPTPKMSTYLVAFIVGDLEFIEDKTEEGILVRVFTTPGKKEQARFALDVAKRVVSFYNNYFGIPYPLPVLDLIAIPDFASGAMENWGAITYRESAILVDPEHSSLGNKQWVAIVIAHEIAHQWFGNLVTMEWWTHLWLNEGFASYVEYLAVDHLFPEWDMWTQFTHSDLGDALELDALKNTHPIEVDVHHPHEIEEVFDRISYSKGASIIRMLAEYLGEDVFRDGLRHYLQKHSYANATTEDLWLALEHVSGKPVRDIMRAWTSKPGYPLITVTEEGDGIKLHQSRFFTSAISRRETEDKTVWYVPISIMENGSRETNLIMDGSVTSLKNVQAEGWVKLNVGETGPFRVHYPKRMLQALRGPIVNKAIGPRDRLGIVRDTFALAESCQLSTIEALELAKAYVEEDDYSVWVELAGDLGNLASLIVHELFRGNFDNFARSIFGNIAGKLGWTVKEGERHTDTLLRSLALYNLGAYGNKEILEKAKEMFRMMVESKTPIHPDLRETVYSLVARNGGLAEYEMFLKLHSEAELQEEKNRIDIKITQTKNNL